jgi:hypothetical protein
LGAALVLGLLLISATPQIQAASNPVGAASAATAALRLVGPLASTNTSTITITKLPSGTPALTCEGLNLENCGIWQDSNGNTYNVTQFVGNQYFELTATYLTDDVCPAALGGGAPFYMKAAFNSSGDTFYFFGSPTMYTCTRATNPIVENCSHNAIWQTTFNATVHFNAGTGQISIVGQYLNQDWTWDTNNGVITNCRVDYTFSQDFTLTPVSTTTSSTSTGPGTPIPPSSTTTSQGQGQGNSNPGPAQTSSRSTTNSSSTSASSHSGSSGSVGWLIPAVVVVILLLAAVSWVFLRKKP